MRLALAFVLALAAAPVSAQTLLGVTLGEPIPEGMPTPIGTQTQPPFARTQWAEIEGAAMTVIGDIETGDVLFIELRPSATATGPVPAQIDGLTFGQTTRADLHAQFGSEGIVFADVGRTGVFGDVAVYFTSYEIEEGDSDTVVSFVTIQPLAEASAEAADQAVLDSVVVANGSYLTQVWGVNRGTLPGYARIADPFTDD